MTNSYFKLWYTEAHNICANFAAQSGYSLEQVVGVVVSFSGQKRWGLNLSQAEDLIFGNKVKGFHSQAQLRSAKRILEGEQPLQVWNKNSLKYREFYASILSPNNEYSVCVDSIMIRWYKDQHKSSCLHNKSLSQIFSSKRLYKIIQDAVRRQAKSWGVLPLQAQALIWCQSRGTTL